MPGPVLSRSEVIHQRVRAERAVAHADAVLGAERRGQQGGIEAGDVEAHHADAVVVAAFPQLVGTHAADRVETREQALEQLLLVSLDALPARRLQRMDRGGDRHGAERGRCASLMARRPGRPFDAVGGDVAHRTAAREVRPGRVEPVRATGEHAGAVRRVDLVTGEGDVVDVPGGDVERTVRRQLGGVERDARSVAVRDEVRHLEAPGCDRGARGCHRPGSSRRRSTPGCTP